MSSYLIVFTAIVFWPTLRLPSIILHAIKCFCVSSYGVLPSGVHKRGQFKFPTYRCLKLHFIVLRVWDRRDERILISSLVNIPLVRYSWLFNSLYLMSLTFVCISECLASFLFGQCFLWIFWRLFPEFKLRSLPFCHHNVFPSWWNHLSSALQNPLLSDFSSVVGKLSLWALLLFSMIMCEKKKSKLEDFAV